MGAFDFFDSYRGLVLQDPETPDNWREKGKSHKTSFVQKIAKFRCMCVQFFSSNSRIRVNVCGWVNFRR